MGLESYSYYGRLDGPLPIRDFTDELIEESKQIMHTELREMEERIRRYMTENKREIITAINEIFSDFKEKSVPTKKEVKNVTVKSKRSVKSDRK